MGKGVWSERKNREGREEGRARKRIGKGESGWEEWGQERGGKIEEEWGWERGRGMGKGEGKGEGQGDWGKR